VTGNANALSGSYDLEGMQIDAGLTLNTNGGSIVDIAGGLDIAAGSILSLGADATALGPISNLGLIRLNGRRLSHPADSVRFTDAAGTPVVAITPGTDPVIGTVADGNLNLDGRRSRWSRA
jgi:hypothetical protein